MTRPAELAATCDECNEPTNYAEAEAGAGFRPLCWLHKVLRPETSTARVYEALVCWPGGPDRPRPVGWWRDVPGVRPAVLRSPPGCRVPVPHPLVRWERGQAMSENPYGLTDADLITVLALNVGNALDVIDGRLCMPDPANPGASVPVPTDTLDRLEAAAFVEVTEAGATLTDRGRYYLGRWMAKHYRRKGRRA